MIDLTATFPMELLAQLGGTPAGPVAHDNPAGVTVAGLLAVNPHVTTTSTLRVLWAADRAVPIGVTQ